MSGSTVPAIVNLIISQPPFSSIGGKEGVDLALVCAAFEQRVNLIFVDQGVLHLLNQQDTAAIDDKMHDKQLKALDLYDIETLFVDKESLQGLGIERSSLIANSKVIDATEIQKYIQSSDYTITV